MLDIVGKRGHLENVVFEMVQISWSGEERNVSFIDWSGVDALKGSS